MLEFLRSGKHRLIRCFPIASAFGHLPFEISCRSDSLDACGPHWDFFKPSQAIRSNQILLDPESFRFLWIFLWFCLLSCHWMILNSNSVGFRYFASAFGSSPEDHLLRYLLFVPIEYHGKSNFSRRNVSQMRTFGLVQNTDFPNQRPFRHWHLRRLRDMMNVLGCFLNQCQKLKELLVGASIARPAEECRFWICFSVNTNLWA